MICEKCMWKTNCEYTPYSEECDKTFCKIINLKKVEKITKKPLTNPKVCDIINTEIKK